MAAIITVKKTARRKNTRDGDKLTAVEKASLLHQKRAEVLDRQGTVYNRLQRSERASHRQDKHRAVEK